MSKPIIKKTFINHQIKASRVRIIDETGKQLGIFQIEEALRMSREQNLDLVQITQKTDPPICKIIDYGKYLYQEKKKKKIAKTKKGGEIKEIRLKFNISLHDLKIKSRQAEKFLKKGDKIKIEMILKGRERKLSEFAQEKINQFLELLKALIPIKIERELKKEARGFTLIISRDKN